MGQLKPYASGWTQACVLYLTTPIIVQTTEMPYLLKVTLNSLAGNPVYTLVALMMESKLGIGDIYVRVDFSLFPNINQSSYRTID